MIISKPSNKESAAASAEKVVQVYQTLLNDIKVGMKISHIDAMVMRILSSLKTKSCFHKYRIPHNPPFPSYCCLSVNDCIIHGTAGYYEQPLKTGDILKIDIGVSYKGWIGDAAWTFAIKDYPSEQAKNLMECGKEALREGIKTLKQGYPVSEWANAIQPVVEKHKFHICEGIGGHGYGRKLHEPPHISNRIESVSTFDRIIWQTGMLVAVEPMIASGTHRIRYTPGSWPVFTEDGSLAVHYEADVLIEENGQTVLTSDMDKLPDIIG